jgi:D-alanyl-D-alanine carboxypeptidase/D-alanyl-D-alanine-endopeptidase (penicillin-binding protein 4)
MQAQINELLASKNAKGAVIGMRVMEAESGRVLYSYHAEDVLSVASNAKIVTTAAALDTLGSKFELTTTLVARGTARDGVLYGDLVLIGKGDPSFSTHWTADVMAPLRRFASEVAANGIRVVTGDIVANDLYLDREFWCPTWPANQWNNWYQAPVGALCFNDNCVDVSVAPGASDGATAALSYYPNVGYVNIVNAIRTTASKKKHGYAFARNKFDNEVTAKGSFYIGGQPSRDNFTVHDPSLYIAAGLRAALADLGIEVRGVMRRMEADEENALVGARVLGVNRIELGEVVKYCNVNSQNLYAEMILKVLGREVMGSGAGSFAGGAAAVGKFLDKLGIHAGTYSTADGSGLSRETRYSAKILTDVLACMYKSPEIVTFRDSLPLAGFNGTMRERLEEPEYRGKVRAKTGYIAGASGLSGYAMTANGKTLIFSMVFNHINGYRYSIRPLQDDICRVLVTSAP